MISIQTASLSMAGGRLYNEDSVRLEERDGILVTVVADGLGGEGGGEIASSVAADCIVHAFLEKPELEPEAIKNLFEEANRQVMAAQTSALRMKTTCVSLFVHGDAALWAHVGDSRLYHFENGRLVFQTRDHSVSQLAVSSGEIDASQIRFHEDRNKVLRALGDRENVKTELSTVCPIGMGFHAFLLCTDGFWEYVLEEEMEIDLAKSRTPEEWVSFMAARLRRKVSGNNDNYTAAAVLITGGERNW